MSKFVLLLLFAVTVFYYGNMVLIEGKAIQVQHNEKYHKALTLE